jgi:hypothetical protein
MASRVNFQAVIVLAYTVAALAYAFQSAETGKGVGGWIVDMIFQLTGILAPRVASVIAFVVLAVPGWFAASKLMRRAAPSKRPAPGSPSCALANFPPHYDLRSCIPMGSLPLACEPRC